MAVTTVGTSDASAKKLYEEQTFRASIKKTYWMGRLVGKGGFDDVMYMNSKLDGVSGDRVSIDLVPRFNFAAIGESGTVENNEGSLDHYTFNLTLEEKNIAVRYKAKLDAKRPAWDLPAKHRERVEERGGEVIDEQVFDALQADDPNKVFYGGSATSTATFVATDLITPKKLTEAKTWMETGGNRSQNAIRKVMVTGGRGVYVFGCHNDVYYDLWNDATIQEANRLAQDRGVNNPLFQEADLVWNDIVVFKHENYDIFTDGGAGSNIAYAKGFMMGAGAVAWAWGARPEIKEESFDYGRQIGINFNYISAAGRPEFNSQDYGVVGMYSARTQISDA